MTCRRRFARCGSTTSAWRSTSATTGRPLSQLRIRVTSYFGGRRSQSLLFFLLFPLDAGRRMRLQFEDAGRQAVGLAVERQPHLVADLIFRRAAQLVVETLAREVLVDLRLQRQRILGLDLQGEQLPRLR